MQLGAWYCHRPRGWPQAHVLANVMRFQTGMVDESRSDWLPFSVLQLEKCCGLTWQAAQHHTAICSVPPERWERESKNGENSWVEIKIL